MKKILNIARNELYTLFYSPIAWILMILFIVMTSSDYLSNADQIISSFQRYGSTGHVTNFITANKDFGFFFNVIKNLYVFFPLITMGLISREISSGTIKLLQSSPIRVREIVLGKYLAILSFTFCLILLITLTLVSLCYDVRNPDYSQLLASLFGIFLVLSSYAAIGLFISSLTAYQIVAALITLGIFALLANIGEVWQEVDLVRDITYYMNITGKSENFVIGLINLRDLMYFLLLIGSFVLFTMIKIKSGTESISKVKKGLRYAAVVGAAFVLGYITSKPAVNVYFDATRDKLHTITPPTQVMLGKLNDGELKITGYANLLNDWFSRFVPSGRNVVYTDLWEQYVRFKPDINIQYVLYYNADSNSSFMKREPGKTMKEVAKLQVESFRLTLDRFLTPEEIKKQVDVEKEENRCFFVLEYKGKKTVLRTFDDTEMWPDENEVAAAINRLVATPPKISFVMGEIERGPFSERTRDYKQMTSKLNERLSLVNQGYDFDTVNLSQVGSVPDGLAALVIADPRLPMAPGNIDKINRYVDNGGNLLVLTEPDRREMTKPILDKLGLSLREGLLVQPSSKFSSDYIVSALTDTAKYIAPQFTRYLKEIRKYEGDSIARVGLAGASVIDYHVKDGFTIEPLLVTDGQASWNRLAPISSDSLQTRVGRKPDDQHNSFVTALRMHRMINGREQRIIVASDADYMTYPQLDAGGAPRRVNFRFGFWSFSYFSYGQFPANTLRPEGEDNSFRVTAVSIPPQRIIYYWIIPGLLVLAASVILVRRKRK